MRRSPTAWSSIPSKLIEEIDDPAGARRPRSASNLHISDRAHVVMPYHKVHDEAHEDRGACRRPERVTAARPGDRHYASAASARPTPTRVYRSTSIRMSDLLDHDRGFAASLRAICPIRVRPARGSRSRRSRRNSIRTSWPTTCHAARGQGARRRTSPTRPTCCTTSWRKDGPMLMEGANASLLDVDHGTYPYVTSLEQLDPRYPGRHRRSLHEHRSRGRDHEGIRDAGRGRERSPRSRTTRSGSGSATAASEYGTTTGRPRRCGWLDLVAVRYSAMICGVTGLACMLLDVLSGFDELQLCTQYRLPTAR